MGTRIEKRRRKNIRTAIPIQDYNEQTVLANLQANGGPNHQDSQQLETSKGFSAKI
jgi:hypothetical protein